MPFSKSAVLAALPLCILLCACDDASTGRVVVVSDLGDAASDDALIDDAGSAMHDAAAVDAMTGPDGANLPDVGIEMPDAAPPVVEGRCVPGEGYESGTPIFEEGTSAWKLDRADPRGNRISVADLDGDGRADLVIRRSGQRADILTDDEATRRRHHWVLRNRGQIFEDVTESSGFLATRGEYPVPVGRPSEVVVFADVDNDGDLDVYSGLDSREPVRIELDGLDAFDVTERSELLLNDGAGRFELSAEAHPLRRMGEQDVPSGASWIDHDLDGTIDLWISQGGLGAPLQDRLFRGQGDGQFTEVTAQVGLSTRDWQQLSDLNEARGHTTAWSAIACDLNRDGYAELLASSYGRAPNHLWRAVPTDDGVRYENQSLASGYAFDGDSSWTDNQFARCYCRSQPQAPGCEMAPPPLINCPPANRANWRHEVDTQLFRSGGNSGATVCEDLNNDGWFDLYTTEIKHWWAGDGSDASEILVNQRDPSVIFERPGRDETGLSMVQSVLAWDEGHITAGAFDFDNDGRLDIYLGATDYPGNYGRLYRNVGEDGAMRFVEIPTADFFEHNRSHGMGVADFDLDGDLDLVVGHSRARCNADADNNCYETTLVRLFENTVGNRNNWLQIELVGGPGTNRAAIGAQVTVDTGTRSLTQQVGGGYGHFGAQRDRVLHFGLAEDCEARVTIRWPNRAQTVQVLDLNAGHRYRIFEGQVAEVVASPNE